METQQEEVPDLAKQFYKGHCTSESTECALRMLYETLNDKAVKVMMHPNQIDWANQIIKKYRPGSTGD